MSRARLLADLKGATTDLAAARRALADEQFRRCMAWRTISYSRRTLSIRLTIAGSASAKLSPITADRHPRPSLFTKANLQ
jgi:hypothetical protein